MKAHQDPSGGLHDSALVERWLVPGVVKDSCLTEVMSTATRVTMTSYGGNTAVLNLPVLNLPVSAPKIGNYLCIF